jgi:cyclic pyranopterin phosphate synthase
MDGDGNARMVDVSAKHDSLRTAIVRCVVRLSAQTMDLLLKDALPKGDVLTTAKIAGIQAAKRTADMIPMCHPLPISHVDIRFSVDEAQAAIGIEAEVRTTYKTGVEMEALVGAQLAAATIYDMCKAVQKDIVIDNCRLVYKSGGKSGIFTAE